MALVGLDPEASSRLYDLTILYMEDALEWCEYLFDLFSPYDVHQNSENITEFPTQEGTVQAIKSSFVRIAILSPAFLERCSSELELLIADKPVVGLLCGVNKQELAALELRLPSHKSWTLADAQEDPKSLTQTTMKVLDEAWKKECEEEAAVVEEESLYLPMTGNPPQTEETEEDVYVAGTMGTIEDSNLYDITDTYDMHIVVPDRIRCNSQKNFYILFPSNSLQEEKAYLVRISGSECSSHVEGKAVNPYVLSVCPPKDMIPGSVMMEVTCDGLMVGSSSATFVSHLDELAENLKNCLEPMNVMCESLGVSPASINQLDNLLYEHIKGFQNNNMLKDALTSSQEGKLTKSDKLYPTALHFAASFGLKNITNYLLGLPGADHAGTIRNRDNLSPAEMAQKNGHEELSDIMYYPVHKDGKSPGYVHMVPGSKPDYDRPRQRDPQAMHKLLEEGSSIYNFYFPTMPQLHRDEDEESSQKYEPIQVVGPPLPGPALPSRMNPTTQSADQFVNTDIDDAVPEWQKELWDIDQQILNKKITTDEAHKLFELWRLSHMDKMTVTSPRTVQHQRGNMVPAKQVSDALREQRIQSTISRPILASSHSVPQTTPYLRAGSVGSDTTTCDILQPELSPILPGNSPGGQRGSNPPPPGSRVISPSNKAYLQYKRKSASWNVDTAPSRPPPAIPSSSPHEDLPDRPPPPPPSDNSNSGRVKLPHIKQKPPVASRPDPPARPSRHAPVPAPRH